MSGRSVTDALAINTKPTTGTHAALALSRQWLSAAGQAPHDAAADERQNQNDRRQDGAVGQQRSGRGEVPAFSVSDVRPAR